MKPCCWRRASADCFVSLLPLFYQHLTVVHFSTKEYIKSFVQHSPVDKKKKETPSVTLFRPMHSEAKRDMFFFSSLLLQFEPCHKYRV